MSPSNGMSLPPFHLARLALPAASEAAAAACGVLLLELLRRSKHLARAQS